MIELLACRLGRYDEVPNIELAEKLCAGMDEAGIREIAGGLKSKEQAVANDCIKVLYEIGQRKPELVAELADDFIDGLGDRNNRIVWGSMTALVCIAPVRPEPLVRRLPEIVAPTKKAASSRWTTPSACLPGCAPQAPAPGQRCSRCCSGTWKNVGLRKFPSTPSGWLCVWTRIAGGPSRVLWRRGWRNCRRRRRPGYRN